MYTELLQINCQTKSSRQISELLPPPPPFPSIQFVLNIVDFTHFLSQNRHISCHIKNKNIWICFSIHVNKNNGVNPHLDYTFIGAHLMDKQTIRIQTYVTCLGIFFPRFCLRLYYIVFSLFLFLLQWHRLSDVIFSFLLVAFYAKIHRPIKMNRKNRTWNQNDIRKW